MSAGPQPSTTLERVVRRDRAVLGAALATIVLLCWAWIVPMARDMYGAMTGPSAWMMTTHWDAPRVVLLCAMWIVMMIGMMLPSAAPLLLLYARIVRQRSADAPAVWRVYALAGGYLAAWTIFSLLATGLQLVLYRVLVLTPMMEMASATAVAGVLLLAGAYQLSPLKSMCLRSCRAPLSFVMQHWKPGTAGAFRMGVVHGAYCVGCCWALMLLLFAGGVMNLVVIAGLTILVLIEKIAPFGGGTSRATGVALIGLGVWMLAAGAPA